MSEETPDVNQQQATAATAAAGQAPQPTPNSLTTSSSGAGGASVAALPGSLEFWQGLVHKWSVEAATTSGVQQAEAEKALAKAEVGLAKKKTELAEAELRLVPAGDEAMKRDKERALAKAEYDLVKAEYDLVKAEYELAKAEAVAAGRDPTTDPLVNTARIAYAALLPSTGAKRLRREDGQDMGLGRFVLEVAKYGAQDVDLKARDILVF